MNKLPQFKNEQLLRQALTHSSYYHEHPYQGEDNERLEFLGDAVLKLVMAKLLYQRYPKMKEGELTKLRADLEKNSQLAEFAKQLELNKSIRLGNGAIWEGNRNNPDLLANVFEAFIGAYFLDSGLDILSKFLEPFLIHKADKIAKELSSNQSFSSNKSNNFKGEFQEWAIDRFGKNPQYNTIDSGPDHTKLFTAEVTINNQCYGIGQGNTKKSAEQNAAEVALKSIYNKQK